ncbi:pericentriolar material 1 protein [Tachysurus ichikawai]
MYNFGQHLHVAPDLSLATRQENLRWAADLSQTLTHLQEQVTQLQRQLDFSTAIWLLLLLQNQQCLFVMTLSCMLQSMLMTPGQ